MASATREGNAYVRKRREAKTGPIQRMTIEDPRKWINLTLGVVMAITAVATAVTSCEQSQMMDAQTQQNKTIIEQMTKQTEQTDAVIKHMRLEQRAWLGIQQPRIVGDLIPGKPLSFVVPVKNSGRTPGTIVEGNVHFVTRPIGDDLSSLLDELKKSLPLPNQQASIAPDATHDFEGMTSDKLGADVYAAIAGTNPKRVLYLIGTFKYTDVMGEERLTQFCFSYSLSPPKLVAHAKHNLMT